MDKRIKKNENYKKIEKVLTQILIIILKTNL